ncbi:MAG: DUF1116 domain-containing protein [Ardenticatenaceae bacterium]|nr:DUF1116 domain-containing protein [Ardenticatenaceae bacterium]HBY96294.1 hypothetical protein [Chloroflexota bacterium]
MSLKEKINAANTRALEILFHSTPRWLDVRPAIEVLPGMKENLILHAGPPIEWNRMASAQKNGVAGAAVFEGLAENIDQAKAMTAAGEILIDACHEYNTVGSMTGVTSPSMPVMVVENEPYGTTAYINVHEGPSRNRLTYGAYNTAVRKNLEWIRDVLGPALGAAVRAMGGMHIGPIIARSLTMGDECHNRPTAGSALFALEVLPYIIESNLDRAEVARVARFLKETEHFFFHLGMAAGKATTDAMSGVPYCSLVTAMARNGVEFGIRVSGTGNRWFVGPAAEIEGVYFSGYGPEDAEADMGDSAIMETTGLGAFAMAASVSMAYAVGGGAADAMRYQESMVDITVARHPAYQIPALDYRGTPVGIDIRKVVQTNILPIIDTAIAHKNGGEIGVGIARPPMECFVQALEGLSVAAQKELSQPAG